MAAVYLHNALYSRNSEETQEPEPDEHSRNLSTVSCATLLTNTTLHSQPTEPLLQPTASPEIARAHNNRVAQSPRNSYGPPPHLRWDEQLTQDTLPESLRGKDESLSRRPRKPWRRRKRVKRTFEIVIAAWAVYNTIRYFTAFTMYRQEAPTGQILCLVLGTSAGISLALALCLFILSTIKHKLLVYGLAAYKHLIFIYSFMNYLSSILLFVPAVVNFAIVFVWRSSSNSGYNLHRRCHIDIDVVWSASANLCNHKSPWGIWLLLASLRLLFTALLLVAYHIIVSLDPDSSRRQMHHRLRSGSESLSLAQSRQRSSLAMMIPNHDNQAQHQDIPDLSLDDTTLRGDAQPHAERSFPLTYSRSSVFSDGTAAEPISLGSSSLSESDGDRGQTGYVDRFRSLLTQITQDTEESLELARNKKPWLNGEITTGLPPFYSLDGYEDDSDHEDDIDDRFHTTNDNIFNLPPIPPSLGYNEFGLPYPPEQDVRILNGYIRRMPTIESMGSGEIASSLSPSSSRPDNLGGSLYTSSRPPTRNTLMSLSSAEYEIAGSNPPSRANSLSARAELLVGLTTITGASEHGELLPRSEVATRRFSGPTSVLDPTHSPTGDTHSSAGSRATASTGSYHTATMGS